jgi:DNA-binding transcriptional regulator of glucitol operon
MKMKIKHIYTLTIISLIAIITSACTVDKDITDIKQENDSQVEKPIEEDESVQDVSEPQDQETPVVIESNDTKSIIEATAAKVIEAISKKDAATLSEYSHPVKGIRFTPYTFVSIEDDVVFTKDEMKDFFTDTKEYLWGYYDGIGDEIKLTPSEYYDKFIYTADFMNAPQVGYNEVLSFGNALENQFEVYDNPIVVEYYFPGFDEEYEGMDWQSLRLVFEQYEDSWKLVGIIHNQWTI